MQHNNKAISSPVVLSSARTKGALQHRSYIANSTRLLLVVEKWHRWPSTANEKTTMTILE
jgi:hypothetical protein